MDRIHDVDAGELLNLQASRHSFGWAAASRLLSKRRGILILNLMKILFLRGWHSIPGGVKPTFLADQGHQVVNPDLSDDDFNRSGSVGAGEFDRRRPDVIVASSRGGAVAMAIDSGDVPLVLLCPRGNWWGRFNDCEEANAVTAFATRRDDPFCG